MCNLIDLPILPLRKILDYLNLKELILIKLVCKKLKYFIDQIQFKRLAIRDSLYRQINYRKLNNFYYTFKKIKLNELIYAKDFNFINSIGIKRHFINLKILKINFKITNHQWFTIIGSNFKRLIHLEINESFELDEVSVLELPLLRKLKAINYGKKLIITTRILESLTCSELWNIGLFNYSSIEYLEVIHMHKGDDLKKYNNLKILKIHDNSYFYKDANDILIKIPDNLNQIYFYFYLIDFIGYHSQDDFIEHILKEKIKLKKYDLNIYFNDIKSIMNRPINEYLQFDNELKLISKNFNDMDKTSFYDDFEFNQIMETFNNQLPKDFFDKIINIQKIKLNGNTNKEFFFEFLKNCPCIYYLEIRNSNLDQNLYDQLPYVNNLLTELKLFQDADQDELNFEFLFKFAALIFFETNLNSFNKIATKLFNKSTFIKSVKYIDNGSKTNVTLNKSLD